MNKVLISLIFFLFFFSVYSQSTKIRPENWAVKIENQNLKNLFKLNDTIYRCEQPDNSGFALLDSLGIKSILNLRTKQTDKQCSGKLPLTLFHIEMHAKKITDNDIVESLKVLINSQKPIVVHCKYGSDRTGVVIALYRIIFQGWTKEQAIQEMRNGEYGFHKFFKNIPEYINNCDISELKKQVLN